MQGQELVVMVDPGATHNFVSTNTVQKLNLSHITTTKEFGVTLGTSDKVQGQGEYKVPSW